MIIDTGSPSHIMTIFGVERWRHPFGHHQQTYKEIGNLGIGPTGTPLVDFTERFALQELIDVDLMVREALVTLPAQTLNFSYVNGIQPSELLNSTNLPFPSEALENLPHAEHERLITRILAVHPNTNGVYALRDLQKHVALYLGTNITWAGNFMLMANPIKKLADGTVVRDFAQKNKDTNVNAPTTFAGERCPGLVKFFESVVTRGLMSSINRAIIYFTFPGTAVTCHRDISVMEHKDHAVSLTPQGDRGHYMWDEVLKKKTYLPGAKAYFFNNCDYHGVDASDKLAYTIRLDGKFSAQVQEELQLKDGFVLHRTYPKAAPHVVQDVETLL